MTQAAVTELDTTIFDRAIKALKVDWEYFLEGYHPDDEMENSDQAHEVLESYHNCMKALDISEEAQEKYELCDEDFPGVVKLIYEKQEDQDRLINWIHKVYMQVGQIAP